MEKDNSYTITAKVLGSGWVECVDPTLQKIYFANLNTKETVWNFPEELLGDSDLVNHPDHWIEAMDAQLHKKYFYNRISKESMWEMPQCLIVQPHAVAGVNNSAVGLSLGKKKGAMISALNDMKTDIEDEEVEQTRLAAAAVHREKAARQEHTIVSTDSDEQRYVDTLLQAVAISTEELYSKTSPERTLCNYGRLNFATAKSKIFKRKISVEALLEWSKHGLQRPLHNMQGEMHTEAIQFSKNIRGFMGDRSSTKSVVEHADKIIKVLLLSSQELRDELFCQLCKQLNKNPSKASAIKGWQLFLICLTSASPNSELMVSLITFFKGFVEGEDREIASYAEDTLHKCYISTHLHGCRCERPNAVEVASIMSANTMYIRIWFLDGLFITVKCDSWMVVSELELIIAKELGVEAPKYFGLYEALLSGEERLLHYDDRVLDLVSQWKRFQGEHDDHTEFIKFVYKVRYFVTIEDEEDTSSIELMYIQAVHDVLNMVDLCTKEDSYDLASLQLHDKWGDHVSDCKTLKILNCEIEEYVPSRVFETVDRQEVVSAVARRYAELTGYNSQEARLEYLQIVRQFSSYGSSYFLVSSSGVLGSGKKSGSKEVVVSITPRGLFVIDNYTKEYIQDYPFEVILTWGHSPTQFILATGTVANKKTISFKCSSGKEMNDMMSVYVAAIPSVA